MKSKKIAAPKVVLKRIKQQNERKESKFKIPMIIKRATSNRYTNTRIRVMKSRLLKEEDYMRLMKMSLPEIARFLQESDYKKEIDALALRMSGAILLEYALSLNLANTFRRIYGYAIKSSKEHIANYLKKWDIWNIKTILRGKREGATVSSILSALVPAGAFSYDFLKHIAETTKSYDEAIEAFKNTEYYPILIENIKNPIELEDALDQYYYDFALKNFPAELQDFIRTQITIINEINKERAKKTKIKLKLLAGAFEDTKKILPKKVATIDDLPLALHKKIIENAVKMVHESSANIRPVIGYFIIKENEIRNLRLLIRGKHVGLPPHLIEKNLVI